MGSSSSLPIHPALELTEILEEIFSRVATPEELLQYRFVCRQWNDAIVHTLNTKWKNYFPLRLRYRTPIQIMFQPRAELLARNILESPTMTLTGSTTPLSFDTVVVDQDFYLAGVNPEWQHFLGIYGESIRHLKFNIRSGELWVKNSHHVTECAPIVSRENLRAAFSSVPNLESLDFCIRFAYYRAEENEMSPQKMFPEAVHVIDLPQLQRLTKITIQEPIDTHYRRPFLNEILGMAPNLTTLYIKCSEDLSIYADVLRTLGHLNNSLRTLGISKTETDSSLTEFEIHDSGFSRFHLTKLELESISGTGRYLEEFLQTQSSSLSTLRLGSRMPSDPDAKPYDSVECCLGGQPRTVTVYPVHDCRPLFQLSFPPIMISLKILHVNVPKFMLPQIRSYQNQFPSLEELTLSKCEDTKCIWLYTQLHSFLPGEHGSSQTVKKFSLLGYMGFEDLNIIIDAVHSTFPFAEHHFDMPTEHGASIPINTDRTFISEITSELARLASRSDHWAGPSGRLPGVSNLGRRK